MLEFAERCIYTCAIKVYNTPHGRQLGIHMRAVARRGLVEVDKATPPVFRFVRQCPGFTKWTEKGGCVFEASKKHVEIWREMFPDVEIEDADGSISKLYVEKIKVEEHPYLTETALEPWKHQRRAHNIMMSRPYYGFFHDMGTGKSATITKGMAELFARGLIDRALVISTSRGRPQFLDEQIVQWMPAGVDYRAAEFPSTKAKKKFLHPRMSLLVAVAAPGAFQSKAQSKEILEFCKGGKTAVFVDECFVAGTQVQTPQGSQPIETIKVGDWVNSARGPRRVTSVNVSFTKVLTCVTLSSGLKLLCTPSHPFFTTEGWVAAAKLEGKELFDDHQLRVLWQGSNAPSSLEERSEGYDASVLQHILLSEMAEPKFSQFSGSDVQQRRQSETSGGEHRSQEARACCAEERSSSPRSCARENIPDTKIEGSQTHGSGWKRQGSYSGAGRLVGKAARLGSRICYRLGKALARVSHQLQGRSSRPSQEASYRSGWKQSRHASSASVGPEEDRQVSPVWVESVAAVECESPVAVYNLGVSGSPFYFAGGVLVHNCQNFKGWSTSRVDNLLKLVPFTTHRFLFSGEPEPKGYEDLFAQFYFMDPNILGHNSLTSFENHFLVKGGYQFKEVVDYRHTDELAELIAPHCEYLKITDCMDMPLRSWHESKFKPTDQQLDLYEGLKRDYAIFVDRALNDTDVETVARHCKNAASRYTAMAQVACGWFYADLKDETLPREVVHITDERAWFTIEEVVGTSEKCLVWARFHEDLEQIKRVCAELKIDAVEFSGRVKPAQCEANKIRFQRDPRCRIFYGTTASGGESLNLQMANRSVYYSNSFNWGHREQSERRTWRAGQTKPCSYWDIIGLPIDRLIRNNAMEKKDLAMQLQIATGLAAMLAQL